MTKVFCHNVLISHLDKQRSSLMLNQHLQLQYQKSFMQMAKYVLFTESFHRLIHASRFDICFSQLAVFIFFTICLAGLDFGPVSLEILASLHG